MLQGKKSVQADLALWPSKAGRVVCCELECAAIVSGGGPELAQMIKADCQVIGNVGVCRGQGMGLEIGLLGFGPALLSGKAVSQCDSRGEGVGLCGKADVEPGFSTSPFRRVGLNEPGERDGVVRVEQEGVTKEGFGLLRLALLQGNGAHSVERVEVFRFALQDLPVLRLCVGQIADGVVIVGTQHEV